MLPWCIHHNQWINIDTLLLKPIVLYLDFLRFYLSFFQDLFQDTTLINFSHHVSFLSLDYDSFSDFPYFVWPWEFWGLQNWNFVDYLSIWVCLVFFLDLDWSHSFGEEGHRVTCLAYHIIIRVHSVDTTYQCWSTDVL